MQRAINLFYRILELLLVAMLGSMAVMVFVNVVMRYAFNSGFVMSDELARYLFVWITFIGAVVTFRENSHMGIETMVMFFNRRWRVFCMILSNLVIVGCASLLFWGAWKQFNINLSMRAPVTGMSMVWVYGIGLFTGPMIVIIALERLYRFVTGRATDEEVAAFAGENLTVEQLAER